MTNKIISLIVLFITIYYPNIVYASSFDSINLNNSYVGKEIWNKNNTSIISHGNLPNLKLLNNMAIKTMGIDSELLTLIKHVEINTRLYDGLNSTSFSNADNTECKINIVYNKNLTTLIFKNLEKDIVFVTTHELSHCILSKKIFTQDIKWQYLLTNQQKNSLKNLIIEKTKNGIISINGKDKIIKPIPLIIYHEVFADTFATLWLYSKNIYSVNDIEEILKKRQQQYNDKQTNTAYLGFLTLTDALKMIKQHNMIFKDQTITEIYKISILLTQKIFINYLLSNNPK